MKYILILLFILLPFQYTWALGLSVRPQELSIFASMGQLAETELLIINSSDEPALYQVYPDDQVKNISIEPPSFRLEPGGNQQVNINVKKWLSGEYKTDISIVSQLPNAQKYAVNAGVKVPLEIIIITPRWIYLLIGLFILFIVLLSIIISKPKKE